MAKGSNGFGGYEEAMEMRDIINMMVQKSLDDNRPSPTYARVYTIDYNARTCMVVINGDTVAVKATCGSIMPSAVDQTVRLEGPPGARYIADVLGPDYVESQAIGTVLFIPPTLGTGFTHNSLNPLRFRVVEDHGLRKVQMRGQLESTGANVTMFTMPVGARPLININGILIGRNVSGGGVAGQMVVNAAGTCVLVGGSTGVQASSGQQTGIGGGAALTSDVTTSANGFLSGRAATSGSTVSMDHNVTTNAQQNAHQHLFQHTHTGGDHQHPLLAVGAPTSLYFDGVEYFL